MTLSVLREYAGSAVAVRALRSTPFVSIAVLSLALGIGANTAVFPLTNILLLRTVGR